MRILLVEDYEQTRTFVAKHLRRAGYAVDTAVDGDDGLAQAGSIDYDAIVLDLMLPKMNGVEVLQRLRADNIDTNILLLTARSSVEDRVAGLKLGADDYLIKPFAMKELLARVEALVRRRYNRKNSKLAVGDLTIDRAARLVTFAGKEIQLRPREFTLLEYLANRQGQVVSRDDIEQHLYDLAATVSSNSIDSAVCRLRRDISEAGAENYIRTIHRQGYVLKKPDVHTSH